MDFAKIKSLMLKMRLDSLYITNATNTRYWSNFIGTNGTLLFTKKSGYLMTDSRYSLEAKKNVFRGIRVVDFEKSKKNLINAAGKNIGFEGMDISYNAFLSLKKKIQKTRLKVRFKDVSAKLNALRMIKTPKELLLLRNAQKITDRIFSKLKKKLRAGMSEKYIGWMIESMSREFGADGISFPPIVGINEHSAQPHHHNTDKKLRKGDMILIDMGVIYKGYCSDMTRVLFTKKPTPLEQKIYSIVFEAQEKGIKNISGGMTGNEADKLSRDIIKQAGYGKYFGHSLGHGVGLDIHELPNLSPATSKKTIVTIPNGTVVTVEPGIYLPGKFGVRLEDMVYVREKGNINLTKSHKSLKETVITIMR